MTGMNRAARDMKSSDLHGWMLSLNVMAASSTCENTFMPNKFTVHGSTSSPRTVDLISVSQVNLHEIPFKFE
jgi:hypothetical protein